MFLTSSPSSKGVALPFEKSGRRALDSAGHRIKEKRYFVLPSEHVYSQREAKS